MALGCQRRDQHRLIFGGGQEQRAVGDKGGGNDSDFRLDLSLRQNSGLSELDHIPVNFRDAVGGGNEIPVAVGRSLEDEPGERTLGTGS